jgi:hypothetical protein
MSIQRIIIIENPTESIILAILGGTYNAKRIAKAFPSASQLPLPYEPTPEQLEAANDPHALDDEMFGLDDHVLPKPKEKRGRKLQPDSLRACMFKALANGPLKRSTLLEEVTKLRKEYGYEPHLSHRAQLDSLSYTHKIVKKDGQWSLPG